MVELRQQASKSGSWYNFGNMRFRNRYQTRSLWRAGCNAEYPFEGGEGVACTCTSEGQGDEPLTTQMANRGWRPTELQLCPCARWAAAYGASIKSGGFDPYASINDAGLAGFGYCVHMNKPFLAGQAGSGGQTGRSLWRRHRLRFT